MQSERTAGVAAPALVPYVYVFRGITYAFDGAAGTVTRTHRWFRARNRTWPVHLFDTVEVRQAMYKGVPDFRLRLLGTEDPGVRLRLTIGVGEADEARVVERARAIAAALGLRFAQRRFDEPELGPPAPAEESPAPVAARVEAPSATPAVHRTTTPGRIGTVQIDRTMAIAAVGWIGEDDTGVRVVDLVAGLQYDLSVPVPARLVGVDSGVVLLVQGHVEYDEVDDARYFVADALVAHDAMQAEVRWTRTIDPGPSVSVTGGIVGLDWAGPLATRRRPDAVDVLLDVRTGEPFDPAAADAARAMALAARPVERMFPEVGGLADQTTQFAAAAEVLAGVVGVRAPDLDLSGVWIEQGWLVVTAARDQVWFISLT